ncbi:MAG: FAD-binding protein [Chloroflexota bacterium]|nr:FAD-binding protein [Chloroflexota bacterium]
MPPAPIGEEWKVEELNGDLLVLGGGMAGMSAAASASCGGARVVLLERAPELGGSAVLSGGNLQTTATFETWKENNPLGNETIGRAIVDGFPEAIAWMASLGGVDLGPDNVWLTTYPHMHGYRMDILAYIRRCQAIVTSGGGFIVTNTVTKALTRDGSDRVTGARVMTSDGEVQVSARHTVLATGGFAASAEMRATYINRNAARMLVRSHPYNRGDGIRLGLEAGAAISPHTDGFYGHLISSPVNRWSPTEFARLSQYQSNFGILVNVFGERFTDESLGDIYNTQALVRQPGLRAACIVDQRIRRTYMSTSHAVGLALIDRFAEAEGNGGHYVRADSIPELARHLESWGFDRGALLRTIYSYNTYSLLPADPPRRARYEPLLEPPYYAVEVQPAITFTHGGVQIDEAARVLDVQGTPIPGLLAAGSDAGGVYHKGYCGGLAAALVLGRRASKTALECS